MAQNEKSQGLMSLMVGCYCTPKTSLLIDIHSGNLNIAGWNMDRIEDDMDISYIKKWGYSIQLCDRLPKGIKLTQIRDSNVNLTVQINKHQRNKTHLY